MFLFLVNNLVSSFLEKGFYALLARLVLLCDIAASNFQTELQTTLILTLPVGMERAA